jgi:Dolichyl-phosphate-mannose-protein mannosyltransferase
VPATHHDNRLTSPVVWLWIAIALACALVISTYSKFGFTWDEPEHLAAGLALIETGNYPYDVQHPPLARLAMAIGPYIDGARGYGTAGPSGEEEGRLILYRGGKYDTYLTLARIGMLPFFIVMLLTTWAWTRHRFGHVEAIAALLILIAMPPVIGHAAVAALDIPMAAMCLLAMYRMLRWFEQPTLKQALLCGLALGAAFATKLSAIPFLGCVGLVWLTAAFFSRHTANVDTQLFSKRSLWQVIAALIVTVIVLTSCYGIGLQPLSKSSSLLVPMGIPRLITSLQTLMEHNSGGHLSYFMGELRRTGWWNFYLVALVVKTPIPTLIMGITGLILLNVSAWRSRDWLPAAPSLAFIAILVFASGYSHINIGVRHVIILFPLLAIGAGVATVYCWQELSHIAIKPMMIALGAWLIIGCVLTYPQNLAYFNELAGQHPEHILVDSDLDWGQDIHHLGDALRKRGITQLSIAFRGTAELADENLPTYKRIWGNEHVKGWVAVNLLAKYTDENRDLAWLDAYQPVVRIGRSIDLYYIE